MFVLHSCVERWKLRYSCRNPQICMCCLCGHAFSLFSWKEVYHRHFPLISDRASRLLIRSMESSSVASVFSQIVRKRLISYLRCTRNQAAKSWIVAFFREVARQLDVFSVIVLKVLQSPSSTSCASLQCAILLSHVQYFQPVLCTKTTCFLFSSKINKWNVVKRTTLC